MEHRIPKYLTLVILDCDGVMFDSFRSNVAFYNSVLKKMGECELDTEAEKLCHVYSTPQLFEHLFQKDSVKYEQAMTVARNIDYTPFLEYMDPEPDLYEVLSIIKKRYRIAMATNRGKSAAPLLKRFDLEDTFESVSTILDVEQPKPSPDLLIHCLEETGVSRYEAVYVGDMENDLIAAERAGITFILKGNSIQHPLRIRRLTDLPETLSMGCPPNPHIA